MVCFNLLYFAGSMGYNLEGGQKEDVELPLFDFATISKATNHFSIHNKLGEGGFGLVYKVNNLFCRSRLLYNYNCVVNMLKLVKIGENNSSGYIQLSDLQLAARYIKGL